MNHLFVTYEIAKLLKEKGFNEPCICQYLIQDSTPEMSSPKVINLVPLVTSKAIKVGILPKQVELNLCVPLYQQVVDWFREKHLIIIGVDYEVYNCCGWIKKKSNKNSLFEHRWTNTDESIGTDYYKAFNKAIEEALKLI